METLVIATFTVIGIASIALSWKQKSRLNAIFHTLFAVTVIEWVSTFFNDSSQFLFHAFVGALVLAFLIAEFTRKLKWLGAVVSLALSLGLVLFIGDRELGFGEVNFVIESKFLIMGLVLASIGRIAAELKMHFFKKWFGDEDVKQWLSAVNILFTGAAFYFGSLSSEVVGVMLVGATFLMNSFFSEDENRAAGISVIALAALPFILPESTTDISLVAGDVIFGLFIGAFGVYLLNRLWEGKPSLLSIVLAYGLVLISALGLGYAGSVFAPMGGMDAFLAVITGTTLLSLTTGKSLTGISLMAPLFALGLMLPSLLVNEEQEQAETEIITMNQEPTADGETPKGPELLPLEELNGNHKLVSNASIIQFRLGKDGETKGQFKSVKGNVIIAEDLSKSQIKVELKLEDFTTFSKMRDDHLMTADYFNKTKYPKMKFSATGFEKTGDNSFKVEGKFTMLGKSNTESITLQRVKLGDKLILIGSGSLDRTKYGMTPSATEGNVVDFDYQLELQK